MNRDPREVVIEEGRQRFQDTATPGIKSAVPSEQLHVVAGMAPTQYFRCVFTPGGVLAPAATASAVIEWRTVGDVIGVMLGSDVGDPESLSSLSMKLTVGPNQRAFTMNGQSGTPDFVKFAAIMGIQPLTVAPIYYPVCMNDKWFVDVRNDNLHAHSYAPEVTFWFRGRSRRLEDPR